VDEIWSVRAWGFIGGAFGKRARRRKELGVAQVRSSS
jgi:hypothetical protein